MRHRALVLLPVVITMAQPAAAWAQGNPLGPEFRVNTFTTSAQFVPFVSVDPSGNFVVVWTSTNQDGDNNGIFGQRYAASGAALGPEFRVNTFTTGYQAEPAVSSDAAGNFVVVWASAGEDGSGLGIFGQRYTGTGAPLGTEFRVNTYTTANQLLPDVAADASGNFVVVWASQIQDGSGFGIFGQRYAGSGTPLGPEFRVNTYTTNDQGRYVSVASDPTGNFVVAWISADGSDYGIFAQRYAASGAPLGPEFRVNTYTTARQTYPAVTADMSGNFVVVWQSDVQDGSGTGVFAQRYAVSGAPLGPEFRVNTTTADAQSLPRAAADAAGDFVVVWASYLQDGSNLGVYGQRYLGSGTPLGPEFRVNTYTTAAQTGPVVAGDGLGDFVVVWTSAGQDGSGNGVYAQRFAPIVPVELTHFSVD
jgi:hypothetical protein